jgi:hypothetical protein
MKKQAIALSLNPRPPMRSHPQLVLPAVKPRHVLGTIAAAVPAALVLLALFTIVALILWSERGNDITDC